MSVLRGKHWWSIQPEVVPASTGGNRETRQSDRRCSTCVSGVRVGVSYCRSDAISIRGIERLTSDWRPSGWHTHLCQRKRNESSLRRLHVDGDLERQEAKSHRLRSLGPCQKSIHGVSEKFQGRVKRRE